jgi:hypothetical protein
MFNPNDQSLLPSLTIRSALAAPGPSVPVGTWRARRGMRRVRPNIVRLIPGMTQLPIGYSPR